MPIRKWTPLDIGCRGIDLAESTEITYYTGWQRIRMLPPPKNRSISLQMEGLEWLLAWGFRKIHMREKINYRYWRAFQCVYFALKSGPYAQLLLATCVFTVSENIETLSLMVFPSKIDDF